MSQKWCLAFKVCFWSWGGLRFFFAGLSHVFIFAALEGMLVFLEGGACLPRRGALALKGLLGLKGVLGLERVLDLEAVLGLEGVRGLEEVLSV